MLSYRHGFHAGNHADVLKHSVLLFLHQYLQQKDKPFWVIDTHAGAGQYALQSAFAQKKAEFQQGILPLWTAAKTIKNPLLKNYLNAISAVNSTEHLNNYPGSPAFIAAHLRAQDRLHLFELHSSDFRLLEKQMAQHEKVDKQIIIKNEDGFAGLKALLPPNPRRALVLIDPSYEDKKEYDRVIFALKDALTRFATGTYMIWYPELARLESRDFPKRLKRTCKEYVHVALSVKTPSSDGFGMHGSGLFIVNPPFTLHEELAQALPILQDLLKEDKGAKFTLENS